MSETTPERPPRGPQGAPAPRPAGGTGFAKKVGPLPVWGWVGLAALGGLGYLWWRSHHKAAASTASTATTTSTGATTSTDYAGRDQHAAGRDPAAAGRHVHPGHHHHHAGHHRA